MKKTSSAEQKKTTQLSKNFLLIFVSLAFTITVFFSRWIYQKKQAKTTLPPQPETTVQCNSITPTPVKKEDLNFEAFKTINSTVYVLRTNQNNEIEFGKITDKYFDPYFRGADIKKDEICTPGYTIEDFWFDESTDILFTVENRGPIDLADSRTGPIYQTKVTPYSIISRKKLDDESSGNVYPGQKIADYFKDLDFLLIKAYDYGGVWFNRLYLNGKKKKIAQKAYGGIATLKEYETLTRPGGYINKKIILAEAERYEGENNFDPKLKILSSKLFVNIISIYQIDPITGKKEIILEDDPKLKSLDLASNSSEFLRDNEILLEGYKSPVGSEEVLYGFNVVTGKFRQIKP